MSFGISYDPVFKEHKSQWRHPECPERLDAMLAGLQSSGYWDQHVMVNPRAATMGELEAAHTPDYIEMVLEALDGSFGNIDADTFYAPNSKKAALLAAGGTVDLVKRVHNREFEWGWALNRPPGHHATRDRSMGFCLFNNIAIAAKALITEGLANKVAIFDWDVHHGNGTEDQTKNQKDILFISAHQWPLFPGSGFVEDIGEGGARGYNVNVPLPPGSDDSAFLEIVQQLVLPLFTEFKPDHILVSAGFDAHADDPLASLQASSQCFGSMASSLKEAADKLCGGRITYVLEGGYDMHALSSGASEVASAMSGDRRSEVRQKPPTDRRISTIIDRVKKEILPHWPGLSF